MRNYDIPSEPIPSNLEDADYHQALLDKLKRQGEEAEAEYADEREWIGDLSQLSFAQAIYRRFLSSYAYDKDAQVWRQNYFDAWVEKSPITDIGRFVASVIAEKPPAEHKNWLTLANFKAIAELTEQWLGAHFDADTTVLGLPGGLKLNTDDASIEHTHWQDYIGKELPENAWSGDMDNVSETWQNFVWECLGHYASPDQYAVESFLCQWFGSALTGDCRDEAMLFLYGQPGTGKSTFVDTIMACFGTYGATISGNRVARENNQHLQWLAGLNGKRLVAISELPERGAWQSDTLNDLISGQSVEANRMRQDSINFKSIAHVVATGNHQPKAAASSGTWRRMRILQFQAKPDTPNTALKSELLADLPGVVAWLLKGLDKWIANGRQLTTPDVLMRETDSYRADADPVKQYADTFLVLDAKLGVEVPGLYAHFHQWWLDNVGEKPLGKRRFGTRLDELGWPKSVTVGTIRTRQGMKIVPST